VVATVAAAALSWPGSSLLVAPGLHARFDCGLPVEGARTMNREASSIEETLEKMGERLTPPHVLLAEDDERTRRLLAGSLREDGYDVLEIDSGVELIHALELFGSSRLEVELIISDVRMPGFGAVEVLEYLRYTGWSVPVIVMTAAGDERTHAEARDLDAAMVLDLPFEVAAFKAAISPILPPPASRARVIEA
jgi:CheY-like chemotaxis protein